MYAIFSNSLFLLLYEREKVKIIVYHNISNSFSKLCEGFFLFLKCGCEWKEKNITVHE